MGSKVARSAPRGSISTSEPPWISTSNESATEWSWKILSGNENYCWAHFQRKWLFQVLHVFDYLFTISKRKSAQYWRFWWNRVFERVLKCFFWEKKIGTFWSIFRPNFVPKALRAHKGRYSTKKVPDGCKTDISVPHGCTHGARLFYELVLLSKENILNTQIMKKFGV